MYKIYAEEMAVTASKLCIYHDAENLESICLPDPKLTMEDNSAGQLTLTMPPANAGYDSVNRLTTTLTVYKDDVEIWSGRVISEDMDFWNQRSLTCEGELAFLNDSIQPPEEYQIESTECVRQFLVYLIDIHNAQVETYKQFEVGTVSVHDSNGYLYKYTNYNTTWDCIQEKLLDTYGGHLVITKGSNGKRTLNYYDSYPGTSSQKIEFGKNLLDFTKSWDMTDFATVILPRGAQLETEVVYDDDGNIISGQEEYYEALIPYTNLEDYSASQAVKDDDGHTLGYIRTYLGSSYEKDSEYLGQYVINEVAVSNYGWIAVVVDWSDVTLEDNLWTKAVEYLEDIQFDNLELEMNAIDLHYLGADYETINLLDQVAVLSRPHGLVGTDGNGKLFPVSKMEIPLNDPENSTFTFGDKVTTTITGSTRSTSSEILARIENMKLPSKSNEATVLLQQAINEAQKNANDMIARATEGYITIVYDQDLMFPDSRSQAIYISNTENYTLATDFWVWNSGGLAHYSKTQSQSISEATMGIRNADGTITALPNVALGMDGSIYASYITAGVITADLITAGTLVDASGGKYFYLDVSHGQLFIGQGNNLSDSVSNAGTSYIAMVGPWTVNSSSLYYKNSTVSSTPSSTSVGPYIYFGTDGLNLAWSSHAYMRVQSGQLTAVGADIVTTDGTLSTEMTGGYFKFYYDADGEYSRSDNNMVGGLRATYWNPSGTGVRGVELSLEQRGYFISLGGIPEGNNTYDAPMVINPRSYSLSNNNGTASWNQTVIIFDSCYIGSVTWNDAILITVKDSNNHSDTFSFTSSGSSHTFDISSYYVAFADSATTATKWSSDKTLTISAGTYGSASTGSVDWSNSSYTIDISSIASSIISNAGSSYTHPDPITLTNGIEIKSGGSIILGSYSSSSGAYASTVFESFAYEYHYGQVYMYGNNFFGGSDDRDSGWVQYFYGDTRFYYPVYLGYSRHSSTYVYGDIYLGYSNGYSTYVDGSAYFESITYLGYNGSTTAGNNYTNHATNIMGWTYLYGTLNLTSWAASNAYHIHIYPISENWHMCIGGLSNSESNGYDESIFFGHSLSSSIPGAASNRTYPFLKLRFLASYYNGEWEYSTSDINDYFQLVIDCHRIDIGENSPTEMINIGNSSCTVRQFGSWSTSDISLKTCIHSLEEDSVTYLNIIDNITPVSYIYIDDKYCRQRYGYIANEVYDACNGAYGLVWRGKEDGLLYLNYTDLIPLLHLKIKQLEKRIEELEKPTIIEEDD